MLYFVLIIGALGFLAFAPVADTGTILDAVIGVITKGPHIGPYTNDSDDDGLIDDDPQSLADAMGLSVDELAMARAISSEEGNSETLRQICVAWVIYNNGGP